MDATILRLAVVPLVALETRVAVEDQIRFSEVALQWRRTAVYA
jgi:hypothetical protein